MASKNMTMLVILLTFLFMVSKSDYFAGLPINQTLIDSANTAMEELRDILEYNLDCTG